MELSSSSKIPQLADPVVTPRAQRRHGIVWQPFALEDEVPSPTTSCISSLVFLDSLSASEPVFEMVTAPALKYTHSLPRTQAQAIIANYRAKKITQEAEEELRREAREFASDTWASIEERVGYGKELIRRLSEYADVAADIVQDSPVDNGHSQPCTPSINGSNSSVEASQTEFSSTQSFYDAGDLDVEVVSVHEHYISPTHAKILAELTAEPFEWEAAFDNDHLLPGEKRSSLRRSNSVRFEQSNVPELRVAKMQAFMMTILNGFSTDGCQYMCRRTDCSTVLPTFRSLTYHIHMHDIKPDSERATPVRAYCPACDNTFETQRDLLVHRCPRIMEMIEQNLTSRRWGSHNSGTGRLARAKSSLTKHLKVVARFRK